MNIHQSPERLVPFNDPDAIFDGFTKADIIQLAYCAGDFILAIDEQQIICDVAINSGDHGQIYQWVGRKWSDTVTSESLEKIVQLLDRNASNSQEWRQVNHANDDGEMPVRYKMLQPEKSAYRFAIGRDLKAISALQQRLLKTQQSMERDYLNLRQTETRYRLLFDNIAYPVLIAATDTRHIQQANRACHTLLNATPGTLEQRDYLDLFDPRDRNAVIGYLGAVSVNAGTASLSAKLAGRAEPVQISATPFRQSGRQFILFHIDDGEHEVPKRNSDQDILTVVEQMPDAFVLTNDDQEIIVANRAFVELVQARSVDQLAGSSLNRFVGRPDVDLGLLRKQLKDHMNVRNFSSIVNDLNGGQEPVEISAIMIERDQPLFGYSVRSVGRRERDLPRTNDDLPRSVDQLTELVGRKPLKEIVRESTDLIERMCIEAALIHTSDNRASAAEILGLSRQSLYSKLHRHGLGNLAGRDED